MAFDDEPRLTRVLQEWQVADAPETLEARVLGRPVPWWRAWVTARVPVPLPVAVAVAVLLIWLGLAAGRPRVPAADGGTTVYDLRGFQPVDSVSVRIERSSNVLP